jgi:hypothetical protein
MATMIAFAVIGCGGSTTPAENTASSAPATAAPTATTGGQPGAKVSANAASEQEIEAALSDAGVSNAARWAHEVVEYRPYPADDPNLAKLRENLAKYNPGPQTVDDIVSALTP